mmetsp:Transcript_28773/g.54097  ORF Transcript_28773/g.54097 Transcript_28773/m.54097 type:complete len:91 (-) Transcript_28773:1220-1492(-)
MKAGVVLGEKRHLNILYPSYNTFEVYGVILVYSNHGKMQQVHGYQLKEGKASRNHLPHRDMVKSLFVQGSPPKNNQARWNGLDNAKRGSN